MPRRSRYDPGLAAFPNWGRDQETCYSNDTVRNNIAYGRAECPQKQVEAAARAALAHDFIMDLPAGYEPYIARARSAAFLEESVSASPSRELC